jgi:hypothetical protein
MAKKARKTNRRKKVSQAEPDSLALPDVDGDKSTGVPDPVVVKKNPVLETLKKIEKNTEQTQKILKEGISTNKKSADESGRAERKAEAEDAKGEKIQKAEEVAAKSYGDLFKQNTRSAVKGFGKRVRRGIARLPEDLAERTIPGPLGRIIARTFKQKRIAGDILRKRDAEMAAKPVTEATDAVGSEIYKTPPQVDFGTNPNNQDQGSRAESIGETVAEKLDAIYEENRKSNFKLDKLIEYARGNNDIQEQQNALLEESQTEADRKGKAGQKSLITRDNDRKQEDEGKGGWLDWLMGSGGGGGRGGGFFGRMFGRRSRMGRLFRRGRIGVTRAYRGVRDRLFKNVGQRSPILRAGRSLLGRAKKLLPFGLGGGATTIPTPTSGSMIPSPEVGKDTAKAAAKPGFFSKAWRKLSSAGKMVGEKVSNLGLGKVLSIFKSGGGKVLRKLIKIPVIGSAIEAGLMAMDISDIKSDPTLSPKEKKKRIGEKLSSGLGSMIGAAIGAAGGGTIAGALGLAGGPAALVTGALGAVAGGVAGSYVGEKIGGAIGSAIGGEEIYNIVSSIPGVGSLIAVPGEDSVKTAEEMAPQTKQTQKAAASTGQTLSDLAPTGEDIPGTAPLEPVEYDKSGKPYLRGSPMAPSGAAISAPTQNMMKTNDVLDQAAKMPAKSQGEQKNTVVNAPTNTTAMFAPMRVRDESIQMLANLNRVALG